MNKVHVVTIHFFAAHGPELMGDEVHVFTSPVAAITFLSEEGFEYQHFGGENYGWKREHKEVSRSGHEEIFEVLAEIQECEVRG